MKSHKNSAMKKIKKLLMEIRRVINKGKMRKIRIKLMTYSYHRMKMKIKMKIKIKVKMKK